MRYTKRVNAHFIVGTLPAVLAAMFIFSCSDPLAPVPPVWDVQANVPIASRIVTFEDLINDGDPFTISRDGENILILHRSYPLTGPTLQDSLGMRDFSSSFSQSIGMISYDVPDAAEKAVPLNATFPGLADGMQAVPPIENSGRTAVEVDMRNRFELLQFAQGTIRIDLRNDYAIPVSFPEPLAIVDPAGNGIASLSIPGVIQPGQVYTSAPVSLAGVRLPGVLTVLMRIATPGTNGAQADIDRFSVLTLNASISDTRIEEAIAPVPAQQTSGAQSLDLGSQGLSIREAELKTGTLAIRASSTLPVGAQIDATFDGITLAGAPMRQTFTIGAKGTQSVDMPLAGAVIRPVDGRLIPCSFRLRSDGSPDKAVDILSSEGLQVDISVTGAGLHAFDGVLESRELTIDRASAFSLPLLDSHSGSIQFNGVTGSIRFTNGTQFPLGLTGGTITGSNSRTAQNFQFPFPAAAVGANARTTIPLPDESVTQLFNGFGISGFDRLRMVSRLVLNPGGSSGSIRESDSLSGSVDFDIPLRVSMTDVAHEDTVDVSMTADARKKLERVSSGDIHFDFENGLPFDIQILPDIWDESYKTILPASANQIVPVDVPGAPVDASGAALEPRRSSSILHLEGEDISRIARATYVRVRMLFRTPGGGRVVVRSGNSLTIRAYAAFDVSSKIAGN